jgi:hypothetical protein
MKPLLTLSTLVLAALIVAACGDDGGDDGAVPTLPAATPTSGEAPPTAPDDGSPGPGVTPGVSITDPAQLTPEQQRAVDAVFQDLQRRFDEVAPEDFSFVALTPMTFSDACLDVVDAGTPEVCAQVITPGYAVTMHFGDTNITYHTNEDATNVRFARLDIE